MATRKKLEHGPFMLADVSKWGLAVVTLTIHKEAPFTVAATYFVGFDSDELQDAKDELRLVSRDARRDVEADGEFSFVQFLLTETSKLKADGIDEKSMVAIGGWGDDEWAQKVKDGVLAEPRCMLENGDFPDLTPEGAAETAAEIRAEKAAAKKKAAAESESGSSKTAPTKKRGIKKLPNKAPAGAGAVPKSRGVKKQAAAPAAPAAKTPAKKAPAKKAPAKKAAAAAV